MTPPTTRLICARDLPDLFEMIKSLAAHHDDAPLLSLATLERDVLGSTPWLTVIVATDANELRGYAALTPTAQLQFGVRGMDMHHRFVTPDHRGQGVGRALIAASIAYAKSGHCRFMTVGTHPDNHAAQDVYRAFGFVQRPSGGPRFSLKWDA
jgi:GNAT superfamily N-acetyltransferase